MHLVRDLDLAVVYLTLRVLVSVSLDQELGHPASKLLNREWFGALSCRTLLHYLGARSHLGLSESEHLPHLQGLA